MGYNQKTELWTGYIYRIWNDNNDKEYIGQTITSISERWHNHCSDAISKKKKRSNSILHKAMRKYGRETFHIEKIDEVIAYTKEQAIEMMNELEPMYISIYHSWIKDELGPGYNTEKGGKNKSIPKRAVCKYDTDLNFLEEYDSITTASRVNNIDDSSINSVCHHRWYVAGGFVWAFKDDDPIAPDYSVIAKEKSEATKKYWEAWHKEREKKKKPPKPYISKAMDPEEKRQRKLERLEWNGERIFVYDAFGNVLKIYKDLVDIIENLPIDATELKRNLDGRNLSYKNMVIRYENDDFEKYSRSCRLKPITLYDLFGNHVADFETVIDAEKFCGASSGEIDRAIRRGGSVKGYIPVEYGQKLTRKVKRIDIQIAMKNSDGIVIKVFPSKKSVFRFFNISDGHNELNKAIKNKSLYRGYYWEEIEEYQVEECI